MTDNPVVSSDDEQLILVDSFDREVGFLAKADAPLWLAIVFAVACVGLQYLIGPWLIQGVLDIQWDERGDLLPARNREFLERLCRERGLRMPRIGVIDSHTEGEPTRIVTAGAPDFGGGTVAAQARVFREQFDWFRSAVVCSSCTS